MSLFPRLFRPLKWILPIAAVCLFSCVRTRESVGLPVEPAANAVTEPAVSESGDTNPVWICDSPSARRYHTNRSCGGLKRCKHDVNEQSVEEAEAVGLTLCGMSKCRESGLQGIPD